jgi:hypothetical protein
VATEPQYLTRKQAAGFFRGMGVSISANTLANYAARGQQCGPAFHKQLKRGPVLYTKEDLLDWLKSRMRRVPA